MSSQIRSQFWDLPPEVRTQIYGYVFSGKRLRYVRHLGASSDANDHETRCHSILFASKQSYTESRPVLLDKVQIDATKLIDPRNGRIISRVLRSEMLRHIFVSVDDLYACFERSVDYQEVGTEVLRPIKMCLMKLDNLESLTFDCAEEYKFESDHAERSWIKDAAVPFIQALPHRLLGLDDGVPCIVAHKAVPPMIQAWKERDKSFKLYAEAKAYDYNDKRSMSLPLVLTIPEAQ